LARPPNTLPNTPNTPNNPKQHHGSLSSIMGKCNVIIGKLSAGFSATGTDPGLSAANPGSRLADAEGWAFSLPYFSNDFPSVPNAKPASGCVRPQRWRMARIAPRSQTLLHRGLKSSPCGGNIGNPVRKVKGYALSTWRPAPRLTNLGIARARLCGPAPQGHEQASRKVFVKDKTGRVPHSDG
jgi:hypothetical protein